MQELAACDRNYDAMGDHVRRNGHISSHSNSHVFCISRACQRVIVPQDNARVNRADKLCKLAKMESDTMGACDHPTTSLPQRLGRFGSTLCYPCSRCFSCSNYSDSTKRSRACLCMYRACRLHAGVNLPDELPIQLSQFCWCLLPHSTTTLRRVTMSVVMAEFRHTATRMSFAFHEHVAAR